MTQFVNRAQPRRQAACEPHRARVLVIGAGLAGLSAAYELKNAGVDVLVLEARKRVGGRVKTVALEGPLGGRIEAGGEFVSPGHSQFLDYAHRFNIGLESSGFYDTQPRLLLDGVKLTPPQAARVHADVERFFADMAQEAESIDPDAPWTAPHAAEMDALSVADKLDSSNLHHHTRARLQGFFEGGNAIEAASQSWLAQLAQCAANPHPANALRCRDGASALALALARAIGEDRILTGEPVTRLDYHDGVRVVTATGRVFVGAQVILATPPGTWEDMQLFPALPTDMRPAMGSALKYVQVSDAPLHQRCRSFSNDAITSTWQAAGRALVCFSGGPGATLCAAMAADERDTFYARRVHHMLGDALPPAQSSLFFDWPGHRFTRGGYACPSPGEVTRIGARWLTPHHHLILAGEHTSSGFFGFMEGALRSGIRAAQTALQQATSQSHKGAA